MPKKEAKVKKGAPAASSMKGKVRIFYGKGDSTESVCEVGPNTSVPRVLEAVGSARPLCDTQPLPDGPLLKVPNLNSVELHKLTCLQTVHMIPQPDKPPKAPQKEEHPLFPTRRQWADGFVKVLKEAIEMPALAAKVKKPVLRTQALACVLRALGCMPFRPVLCKGGWGWEEKAGFGKAVKPAQSKLNALYLLLHEGNSLEDAFAKAKLKDVVLVKAGTDKWGFCWNFYTLKINTATIAARAWLAHCPTLGITVKLAGFGGNHPDVGSAQAERDYGAPSTLIAKLEAVVEKERDAWATKDAEARKRESARKARVMQKVSTALATLEGYKATLASGEKPEGTRRTKKTKKGDQSEDTKQVENGATTTAKKKKKVKAVNTCLKPSVIPYVWIRVG